MGKRAKKKIRAMFRSKRTHERRKNKLVTELPDALLELYRKLNATKNITIDSGSAQKR